MKKIILLMLCLIPTIYAFYIYPSLPEIIPTHFGIDGKADDWSSKYFIFLGAILPWFGWILFLFIKKFDPKNKVEEMGTKFDNFMMLNVLFMSILGIFCIQSMSSGETKIDVKMITRIVGGLLLVVGNYMPSMKPNYFMGIRNPWTLENEVVWKKTHNLGGKLTVIFSLVLIISTFFLDNQSIFKAILICSITPGLIAMIYSYQIFQKIKKTGLSIFIFFVCSQLSSQHFSNTESEKYIQIKEGKIFGTLLEPNYEKKPIIVLIISGSGPTDRDGNNPQIKNNSLKYLAEELAKNGIASLRFDKRGIGQSKMKDFPEDSMNFNKIVSDANLWIDSIKRMNKFKNIVICGHSEGSLIGMLCAHRVQRYISLAGPGYSADMILKTQLSKTNQQFQDICFPKIDSLKKGQYLNNVNPMLYSLFRPSIQPYLISWFQYNPQDEIKKLKIPTLIIQGDSDIQVSVDNAKMLHSAQPNSELVIVPMVNHVLKVIHNPTEQKESYNKPEWPISEMLMKSILDFLMGC